jgi:hypothetical protein
MTFLCLLVLLLGQTMPEKLHSLVLRWAVIFGPIVTVYAGLILGVIFDSELQTKIHVATREGSEGKADAGRPISNLLSRRSIQ